VPADSGGQTRSVVELTRPRGADGSPKGPPRRPGSRQHPRGRRAPPVATAGCLGRSEQHEKPSHYRAGPTRDDGQHAIRRENHMTDATTGPSHPPETPPRRAGSSWRSTSGCAPPGSCAAICSSSTGACIAPRVCWPGSTRPPTGSCSIGPRTRSRPPRRPRRCRWLGSRGRRRPSCCPTHPVRCIWVVITAGSTGHLGLAPNSPRQRPGRRKLGSSAGPSPCRPPWRSTSAERDRAGRYRSQIRTSASGGGSHRASSATRLDGGPA